MQIFRGKAPTDSTENHGTRLTQGRDFTECKRFHGGVGALRALPRLTQKKLSQIPQIPQIFADRFLDYADYLWIV